MIGTVALRSLRPARKGLSLMRNPLTIPVMLSAVVLLPIAASASVPVAPCRSGDKTETSLQGLTTADDIASGRAAQGFTGNTDMVGQYQGEGASWQLAAFKNCGYVDKVNRARQ